MNRFAVFLRGVNVGGVTITSAKLRAALDDDPLTEVRTLLASGNVLCSTTLSAAEAKATIEQRLRDAFGYDAWVVVLSRKAVERIAAACPFPADSADEHAYVTLASDPAALDELVAAAVAAGGDEPVRLDRYAIAWTAPVGGTLASPLTKVSAKKRFKETTTTRNLRTLLKVVAAD
ncbi:pyridoxamine 5'-phosphate oxidase [Tersicoccus solisilvae]|uniref:Pyridoxamine 5'-phosphate oxidase n=1 Tax=Tersicoccus solisilvae TaxID=1882339 RepID=A0ABQ1PD11_9MICC|nr:DUF1697 domain-containing protein [Tersicoccus solisilvae]GGC94809.1 pyridoxamine 5'-phosphate oxidase [Tersicoccus solisilvae]